MDEEEGHRVEEPCDQDRKHGRRKEESGREEGPGELPALEARKQQSDFPGVTGDKRSSVLRFFCLEDRSGPGVWAPGLTMEQHSAEPLPQRPWGSREFISAR